jgi:hypothetical protein
MGLAMGDDKKGRPPLRGEAAWKAEKEAIAKRNEAASRVARERRQKRDDQHASEQHAADMRERAQLAKRKP